MMFAKLPFPLRRHAQQVEKGTLMAASVHMADILSGAPESRALKGSRGMQIAPNSLTEGVAWLFEALRATDYFDQRILCSHERLPMPERAQMARAYYHALPPYEQVLIDRAAALHRLSFHCCASVVNSDGCKVGPPPFSSMNSTPVERHERIA
jgi:hypothetical protein